MGFLRLEEVELVACGEVEKAEIDGSLRTLGGKRCGRPQGESVAG